MANSPMLDAIRNKRMGGINLTILVGESPEEMQDEQETKELGLAPDADAVSEDSGSLEQGPMGKDDEQMLIQNELAKAGLGKMGRKPGMVK